MKKIAISVILPFYNSEETLHDAVVSILNQSFIDFECILVDDGSVDNSTLIAEQLVKKDTRVRLIKTGHLGIVNALNTGISESVGEFIARMDSDDISYPERLIKQYDFMIANPDVGLVSSKVEFSGYGSLSEGYKQYVDSLNSIISSEDIIFNQFVESPVAHPTVMFRRELVDKYGFYKNGDFPEDYELWLRFLSNGVRFEKIPEVLLNWHDYSGRLSRSDKRYSIENFFRCKSVYLCEWLKKNNRLYPEIVVWGAGRKSRKYSRFLEELGIRIKYYIDVDPAKCKNSNDKVIFYKNLKAKEDIFIVPFVLNRGASNQIRSYLLDLGFLEGKNFIMAA